jgi:hypothetical protein
VLVIGDKPGITDINVAHVFERDREVVDLSNVSQVDGVLGIAGA